MVKAHAAMKKSVSICATSPEVSACAKAHFLKGLKMIPFVQITSVAFKVLKSRFPIKS